MKSKKANLIINITKNIVEQYREQLVNLIESGQISDVLINGYLESVNIILQNFDESVFNGEIKLTNKELAKQGLGYEAFYYRQSGINNKDMNLIEIPIVGFAGEEELELELSKYGCAKVLDQLGIPKSIMHPITYHVMSDKIDDPYTETLLIKNAQENGLYQDDGMYNAGEIKINRNIKNNLTMIDDKCFLTNIPKRKPVFFGTGVNLKLDFNPIGNIVMDYIDNKIEFDEPVSTPFEDLRGIHQIEHLCDVLATVLTMDKYGQLEKNYSSFYWRTYSQLTELRHNCLMFKNFEYCDEVLKCGQPLKDSDIRYVYSQVNWFDDNVSEEFESSLNNGIKVKKKTNKDTV